MGVIRWEQNVKNKKGVIQWQEVWKWEMGVNVAAHTRHIFLGSASPGHTTVLTHPDPQTSYESLMYNTFATVTTASWSIPL